MNLIQERINKIEKHMNLLQSELKLLKRDLVVHLGHKTKITEQEPEEQPKPQEAPQKPKERLCPFQAAKIEDCDRDFYLKRFWQGRKVSNLSDAAYKDIVEIIGLCNNPEQAQMDENLYLAFFDDCSRLDTPFYREDVLDLYKKHLAGGLTKRNLWAIVYMGKHARKLLEQV